MARTRPLKSRPVVDATSTRRGALMGALAAGASLALPRTARAHVRRPSSSDTELDDCGVASGDPAHDAVTLWTRVPDSVRARLGVGTGDAPQLTWWVAVDDDGATRVVRTGHVTVSSDTDWTAHARPTGLRANARYRYGFALDDHWRSVVGEARTLPAPGDALPLARLAYGSCQYFGLGHFHVLDVVARARPDFFIHLGDSIYERVSERSAFFHVREDPIGEALTLDDYREKHRRNLTDPAYREARRTTTWICLPDDHDVSNNWVGTDPAGAPRRRAAAQAYREHMPVSHDPFAPRTYRLGTLATLHALDERSRRSGPVCRDRGFMGYSADCDARHDEARTMLGHDERAALIERLRTSDTRWQVLLSTTMMMPQRVVARPLPEDAREELLPHSPFRAEHQEERVVDVKREHALFGSLDAWDGFPVERARLVDALARRGRGDTLVFTGDVHNLYAGHLEAGTRPVGFEVSTGSITTVGVSDVFGLGLHRLVARQVRAANPHMTALNLKDHMFVMCTLTRDGAVFESHCVESVRETSTRSFIGERIAVARGTLAVS